MGTDAETGFSVVTDTVTVFSFGTDAVTGLSVGTDAVTDADACFFSKAFTWFLIVFYLVTEENFHTL